MKTLRIGTRASELALWQANLVKKLLAELGCDSSIVEISSTGDEVLDKPLHQIGGMGLFTKTLDDAMFRGEIDIAVHSLKDVPTELPAGIVQAAVLKRAIELDVIVYKNNTDFLTEEGTATIATGSLRRKAQWLAKYPTHTITGLRGNVNTRLRKLKENDWNGAVFAGAGLQRINLLPENHVVLDWMIPAPAQGAIMITALGNDKEVLDLCAKINHESTEKAVWVERLFMRTLEGGCTAPIGGNAKIEGDTIHFKGILSDLDGKTNLTVQKSGPLSEYKTFGATCANEIIAEGGAVLMKKIKKEAKI
ncbi:MAG: hydroxymethylbilane synthase [Flavobacteriaceae bacterium]|nr:hydroxymethylbilane synthase [Flavobacteriaceae bacterium]